MNISKILFLTVFVYTCFANAETPAEENVRYRNLFNGSGAPSAQAVAGMYAGQCSAGEMGTSEPAVLIGIGSSAGLQFTVFYKNLEYFPEDYFYVDLESKRAELDVYRDTILVNTKLAYIDNNQLVGSFQKPGEDWGLNYSLRIDTSTGTLIAKEFRVAAAGDIEEWEGVCFFDKRIGN